MNHNMIDMIQKRNNDYMCDYDYCKYDNKMWIWMSELHTVLHAKTILEEKMGDQQSGALTKNRV